MSRRQFGTVRRLPSGRWQARYWNGLDERVTAPQTFATKGDAQRWLAVTQADLLRGTYIDPTAGQVTFARWAEEWLGSNPAKRAASVARDRAALGTHLLPILGDLPLASITPRHVRTAVEAMRAKGLSPKSIRTYTGTLVAVFNAAVDAELIGRSPVRGINLERTKRRDRPTLTPDQLYRLADEVPGRYRALVLLASGLGLRWSEVIALRPSDVDFLRRTISVRQTVEEVDGKVAVVEATKSDASRRTMAVAPTLLEELARHLATYRSQAEPDDLCFVGERGGVLRRHFLARVLKPALVRVGLPAGRRTGIDFHGLRHVAASLMVASGEHPKVMQARLGHSSQELTMGLYAHVPDDADRAAAARLDAMFRSAAAEHEASTPRVIPDGQKGVGRAYPSGGEG
jgi:integrase